MRNYFLGLCLLFALCFTACSHSDDSVDVLIIGGGASGVTAGIQSARMGAVTLIVEETEWLGGMLTSAGVSAVDGNYDLPAGLFGEFRGHLADYYGGLDSLKTGWVSSVLFEPSVGNKIFHEMVNAEKNLKVWHNATLVNLERENDSWIAQIQMQDHTIKKVSAKILIDGTELGDIAKMCGVKYDIGMESRHDTKEDIAPEEENNIVQDITYVAILKDYGKDVTIPCPEGYNKDEFACAGASGVTAGIQSARMGAVTLIVEETEWLGGMLTSAGVSAVDGNYDLPAGLFGEFRGHLADYYGGLDSLKTGWVSSVLFEPSVGNKIFHEMVNAEKNLKVWHNATLVNLERENDSWIAQIQMQDHTIKKVSAKILIDGTELGDIAKMCGVKYDIGMESRHDTKEDIAPEEENNIVQDITYVAILKDYGKDVTIPCPEGYNKDEFACACASPVCITPKEPDRVWSKEMMITYGKLPNNKYMINWPIEGNDYYVNLVEMTREEREEALKYAKHYTMCFVYFLQHELGFNTLGLADDEYPTADKLPFIPYHRESRRIHGLVRFNLNHVCEPFKQSQPLYRTCIAVGNYPVDHHHTRYHGYEELPNLYFHPVPSYGLPLGTLIPKDVKGLIVAEKSISVSNIINGTTRLQPMVMQIGQAAGALAALAVKENKSISEVSVREVQNAILDAKGYLLPYLDVAIDHPMFKSLQRVGSTGILKGIGKSVDWANQMWFRADTLLLANELEGLGDVYPFVNKQVIEGNNTISIQKATEMIGEIAEKEGIEIKEGRVEEIWNEFDLKNFDMDRDILRSEMAILIDQILDPFNNKKVDITGQYIQ